MRATGCAQGGFAPRIIGLPAARVRAGTVIAQGATPPFDGDPTVRDGGERAGMLDAAPRRDRGANPARPGADPRDRDRSRMRRGDIRVAR